MQTLSWAASLAAVYGKKKRDLAPGKPEKRTKKLKS